MSKAHNFIAQAVGDDQVVIASAGIVIVVATLIGLSALRSLKNTKDPLVPDDKLSSRNFFELVTVFIMQLSDSVMGKENRKYIPFVASLFIYLFFSNFIGLIPGLSGPTGSRIPDGLLFNLGVALTVFFAYHIWGLREVGFKSYISHFFGGSDFVKFPMIIVGLMVFCIELISHSVRPVSLTLRLFGNMTGDHLVLEVFTDLTKLVIPVIFYGLGTFVSFMQAFVFTMLTMIYIGSAVAHEDHH